MKKRKNNKKLIISLSAIFIIIILLIITFTMWPFKSYKIIETKTFSEIQGFTFEYPEFKKWEVSLVKKINDNEYLIFFKCPFETVVAPSMKIEKVIIDNLPQPTLNLVNKNNVQYYTKATNKSPTGGKADIGEVNFYSENFMVKIYPYLHEGYGYSGKIMTKTIIESFKFTPKIIFIIKDNNRTEIGRIDFTNSTSGELSITKKGKEAEKLKKVWEEIKNKSSLTYDFENKEGDKLTMYSKITKPNEEDFKWGIYSYLEQKQDYIIETK